MSLPTYMNRVMVVNQPVSFKADELLSQIEALILAQDILSPIQKRNEIAIARQVIKRGGIDTNVLRSLAASTVFLPQYMEIIRAMQSGNMTINFLGGIFNVVSGAFQQIAGIGSDPLCRTTACELEQIKKTLTPQDFQQWSPLITQIYRQFGLDINRDQEQLKHEVAAAKHSQSFDNTRRRLTEWLTNSARQGHVTLAHLRISPQELAAQQQNNMGARINQRGEIGDFIASPLGLGLILVVIWFVFFRKKRRR